MAVIYQFAPRTNVTQLDKPELPGYGPQQLESRRFHGRGLLFYRWRPLCMRIGESWALERIMLGSNLTRKYGIEGMCGNQFFALERDVGNGCTLLVTLPRIDAKGPFAYKVLFFPKGDYRPHEYVDKLTEFLHSRIPEV